MNRDEFGPGETPARFLCVGKRAGFVRVTRKKVLDSVTLVCYILAIIGELYGQRSMRPWAAAFNPKSIRFPTPEPGYGETNPRGCAAQNRD